VERAGIKCSNPAVPASAALSAAVFQCITFGVSSNRSERSSLRQQTLPGLLLKSAAAQWSSAASLHSAAARSFSSSEASPDLHDAALRYWLGPQALLALAAARQNLYAPATLSVFPLRPSPQAETFECYLHSYSRQENCSKTTDARYPSTHNI